MKYFGGLVVLLYAAMAFSGGSPSRRKSGAVCRMKSGADPTACSSATGGFHGGK